MILLSAMKEMADNYRDNPDPAKDSSQRERDRDQGGKAGCEIIYQRGKRRGAYCQIKDLPIKGFRAAGITPPPCCKRSKKRYRLIKEPLNQAWDNTDTQHDCEQGKADRQDNADIRDNAFNERFQHIGSNGDSREVCTSRA